MKHPEIGDLVYFIWLNEIFKGEIVDIITYCKNKTIKYEVKPDGISENIIVSGDKIAFGVEYLINGLKHSFRERYNEDI
ncbi:MAG: hypothetical protein FWC41_08600 [Firmicutes bacterium]|nr:hypothetical protein [Bacillota bacterium]